MKMKMNAGLFELDNSEEQNEILERDLKNLLFLSKKYKNIPLLKEDLSKVISLLEPMIKNMNKSK